MMCGNINSFQIYISTLKTVLHLLLRLIKLCQSSRYCSLTLQDDYHMELVSGLVFLRILANAEGPILRLICITVC